MTKATIRVIDWPATWATGIPCLHTVMVRADNRRIIDAPLNMHGLIPTNLVVHYVSENHRIIPHEFILMEARHNGLNKHLGGLN